MSWPSTSLPPRPHDKERLAVAWTRWEERAARPADDRAVLLLEALFGNSPYLTQCMIDDAGFAIDLLRRGPDVTTTVLSDLAMRVGGGHQRLVRL